MSETRSLSLRDLRDRLNQCLSVGGTWNPDLLEADKLSRLLLDVRDGLDAVLRSQEPPPEEDGKLTRCLFCHADLGKCEHTRDQWTVTKGPTQAQLHHAIMNLPLRAESTEYTVHEWGAYKDGHRDARHAAAELVVGDTPVSAERSHDQA